MPGAREIASSLTLLAMTEKGADPLPPLWLRWTALFSFLLKFSPELSIGNTYAAIDR